MIGKIKVLGAAFMALAAMGALASVASAGTADIGATPSVVTAEIESGQQHILTIPDPPDAPFNSLCEAASIEGTVSGQSVQEATVTPTYSGCKLAGQAAQVLLNGCKYTLTGNGAGIGSNTFNVDVVGCTEGKQIQIKSAICTVDIPAQNGLSHVVASNIGGASKEVTLNATVTGITAVQTGAACPQGNNAHTTGASFSGNTIAKAFKDAGGTQVTKHSHQYTQFTVGEQVTLVST